MTPSDYAAEELAMWEKALHGQRQAELQLGEARMNSSQHALVIELTQQVQALRIRADLLLAEAAKVKSLHRDRIATSWVITTQSDHLQSDQTSE